MSRLLVVSIASKRSTIFGTIAGAVSAPERCNFAECAVDRFVRVYLLLIGTFLLAGCCTTPSSLDEYAFKVAASPEIHVPAADGRYFVAVSFTNDCSRTFCFERTGRNDGLVPQLEIQMTEGDPFLLDSIDLSGLSGVKVAPGRSVEGANSPLRNTPIGYYLKRNPNALRDSGTLTWSLKVSSPSSINSGELIASGKTLVRLRAAEEVYLLVSEQVPYASHPLR